MRPAVRHAMAIAAVTVVAGLGLLTLYGRTAADRTDAEAVRSHEPASFDGGEDVPPVDPLPWAGVAWQELEPRFGPGDAEPIRMDGVVDTGKLIVAWGRASTPERNQFNEMGAVFVTGDGRSWRTILLDHGVGPRDTSEPAGIAFGNDGLLAYGGVCCETEARAVWHSPDGMRWTRLPINGEFDANGTWFSAVAGFGDGWIAIGNLPDGHAAGIWASSDGSTWEAVEADADGLASASLSDLAVGPDGLVAVGTVDGPDGTHDGGIWRSADGRSWKRIGVDDATLSGPGETELYGVVIHAGGMLLTGNHGLTEDRVQCENLLGMVASSDPLPPAETATSCGWGSLHHWVSVDGQQWQRVDPAGGEGVHPIELRVIAAGGPGVVVLGESSGPGSPDTTLFTSPDGVRWTAAAPARPMNDAVAVGLVVEGRRLLAVTEHFDGARSTFRIWLGLVE